MFTAPPLQPGHLLHIWHFRTLLVDLFHNLFTSAHSWNHLVSLLPGPSSPPTPSVVLTQPCCHKGSYSFPHLQLCLVFHSKCPRCPRMPAEIMVSTCPHAPLPDEATDRLFLILGPPNFLRVSIGTMWGFSIEFRGV